MRILIIGAGVTGSLFASYLVSNREKLQKKLKEEIGISLLARGETYKRLSENGLKINHVLQNIITIDQVPVIKSLESNDKYDYVLIFLRKTQVEDLLPALSTIRSGVFIFFGNNGTGTEGICPPIPGNKVVLGFAGVGGRKDKDAVYSVHGKKPSLTFGRTGPDIKKIRLLRKILISCGIKVKLSRQMDSWLKYHMALVLPLAMALYRDGGDNVSLSRNKELMKQMVKAIREAYNGLRRLKFPVEPFKLRIMLLAPDSLIRQKLTKLLASPTGRLLIYDHTTAAPEEMHELSRQLLSILSDDEVAKENMEDLFRQKN